MQHACLNVKVDQQNLHFVDLRRSAHSSATYPFGILATKLEIGGVKNDLSEWKGIDAFWHDSTTRPTSRTSWGSSVLFFAKYSALGASINAPSWYNPDKHSLMSNNASAWSQEGNNKQKTKFVYIPIHQSRQLTLHGDKMHNIHKPYIIRRPKLYNNPSSKIYKGWIRERKKSCKTLQSHTFQVQRKLSFPNNFPSTPIFQPLAE